jgi:signal transduction histidine kinase
LRSAASGLSQRQLSLRRHDQHCTVQTRARTVDHLGREQIADTPTAISELWKNAFDAYARNVALNIFDGEQPVAVIDDDGHGMNRDEFVNRWLVVGTDSKAATDRTPLEDRNGLPVRNRQGQKGIGRLSCANLGPVLLLVSRRRAHPFVAALLDWRLFENPFLNLSDIRIPVIEFDERHEMFERFSELVGGLALNLSDPGDEQRSQRLESAWSNYDDYYRSENEAGFSNRLQAPSDELRSTVTSLSFDDRHVQQWPVWTGEADHGTALLISGINYDLQVELNTKIADPSALAARDRFFETLSSFVDPFTDQGLNEARAADLDFHYSVRAWHGSSPTLVVGSEKQFDRRLLDGLEHQIIGTIDDDGVFTGRVKAFGQWVTEPCQIEPPRDLSIPRRADTAVGPLDLYIASMEFVAANTTLPKLEFQRYQELAKRYSGFMIFRDGLRVLPYGRTDNDFFEIESRRSKNAGREFWNHRQMFGRLAITRRDNPNLKDKAGREGLLDNRAAKTLKLIVANILMQSARLYFGSASTIRDETLPQVKASNKAERAKAERNKLRQRQRKEFRAKLDTFTLELPPVISDLERFAQNLVIRDESEIADAQANFERFKDNVASYRLSGAPQNLGSMEDKYADYRDSMRAANAIIESLSADIEEQIERINPAKPRELLERQLARHGSQIAYRIQQWKKSIGSLQTAEFNRIQDLIAHRNKVYQAEASPILATFDRGDIPFAEAAKQLEVAKIRVDTENEELFLPYIGALESLKESIDLEHLAAFGMEEANDMRVELDRLNSLAQLGIAVEIVGHELQAYDDIMGSALRRLPADVRASAAAKDIEFGYEGLTDQLRFLSPLRLAGQKIQRWITGAEIANYLSDFFKIQLANNRVAFEATHAFRAFRVFDQQSRLYPVFINLLNNSLYWVSTADGADRRIVLDVVNDAVVVSDSGPGVDPEDIDSLFTLFFTRKARGGRGVGLYLSRANLSAGGHRIRYELPSEDWPLDGANSLSNSGEQNSMPSEHYATFIADAFIKPIRSVLIVDDDYPTIEDIVDLEIRHAGDNRPRRNGKKWYDSPERIKTVIDNFRRPERSLLVDIHDGQNVDAQGDAKIASHLHQSDLLVLDYELDKTRPGDGYRAIEILRSLMDNDHFNLVVVHTSEKLDLAYREIITGLLSPVDIPLTDNERRKCIDLIAEREDIDDQFSASLEAAMGIEQYLHLRLYPTQYSRLIAKKFQPYAGFTDLADAAEWSEDDRKLVGQHVLDRVQQRLRKNMNGSTVKNMRWSTTAVRWIKTDSNFIAFSEKGDDDNLLEDLQVALQAWRPQPSRLFMAKLRAEIDEYGVVAQTDALERKFASARWYSALLKSEKYDRRWRIAETVKRHSDQLLRTILPRVEEFATELIKAEKASGDAHAICKDHFNVDLNDASAAERADLEHNAYVGSTAPHGWHLYTGDVLQLKDEHWLCLSPACDLVPGQSNKRYEIYGDRRPFTAVKLFPVVDKPLKRIRVQANLHVFLEIDGDTKIFSFNAQGSEGTAPTWRTFYAEKHGVFDQDAFTLKIAVPRAGTRRLIYDREIATVIAQLRYEYALNLLQKLGASMTRIGLDFVGGA